MLRHKHKTLWAVPNKTLADAAGAGRSAMKLQRVYKLVTKGQHIWWQDMVTCLWLILSRSSIYIPFKCWLISSTKGRLNIRSCWTPWDSPDRLAWSIYFPVSSSVFFSVFFFFFLQTDKAPFTPCCKALIPHLTQVVLSQIRACVVQKKGTCTEKISLFNEHENPIKTRKTLRAIERPHFNWDGDRVKMSSGENELHSSHGYIDR